MWKMLFISIFLLTGAISLAEQPVPEQGGMITDSGGYLSDAEKNSIESGMKSLEDATGVNMQILIVKGVPGESIGHFASRVDQEWHPEENVVSKEVLLVVSPSDNTASLVIGEGLSRIIPEERTPSLLEQSVLPGLRAGHVASALNSGVSLISKVIEQARVDNDLATPLHAMLGKPSSSGEISSYFLLMGGLLGVLAAIVYVGKRRDLTEYFKNKRKRHAPGR